MGESPNGRQDAAAVQQDIIRYFEVAGPDYAAWSPSYNMHFGLWARGMNPLRREPMLERMNQAVLDRLGHTADPVVLADLGCGLGAAARYIAVRQPSATISGYTIVPWQVSEGNRLTAESGLDGRVTLALADYTRTPAADASFAGAYALESGCYATGADKADLIAEMARIVRPGGRVVIADGFRKRSGSLGPLFGPIYRGACRAWALREMAVIDQFVAALASHGFVDVTVEDISWRVAPSFAHIPFLSAKFAIQRVLAGDLVWKRERWQNLEGPFLGSLCGLNRRQFGYYLVSATRGGAAAAEVTT